MRPKTALMPESARPTPRASPATPAVSDSVSLTETDQGRITKRLGILIHVTILLTTAALEHQHPMTVGALVGAGAVGTERFGAEPVIGGRVQPATPGPDSSRIGDIIATCLGRIDLTVEPRQWYGRGRDPFR